MLTILQCATPDSRIEMPDYCERSVFESIVNALVHRDYLINGSEVHIDIFDNRLVIYSPGGMPDGTNIQERNIDMIPSTRRNPVLADVFSRLGYMERQGSGLNKIKSAYENAINYTPEMKPEFYSDSVQFTVTLKNLNYKAVKENTGGKSGLTENEIIVLTLIIEQPSLSVGTISEQSTIGRRTVERALHSLKEKGIIVREGSKRSGYWKIIKSDLQK